MPFPILQHQEAPCCRTCEPCPILMLLSLGIDSGCHQPTSTVGAAVLQGVIAMLTVSWCRWWAWQPSGNWPQAENLNSRFPHAPCWARQSDGS